MSKKHHAKKKNEDQAHLATEQDSHEQNSDVSEQTNETTNHEDDLEKTQAFADDDSSEPIKEKIKIEFPYSELVRDRVPKVFEVAENVANQWVNNEKFENIGFSHPIAEIAAVKTLEKAKEVEKKLEEKGVITAAKMGLQIAKLQAESFLSKIKKS